MAVRKAHFANLREWGMSHAEFLAGERLKNPEILLWLVGNKNIGTPADYGKFF